MRHDLPAALIDNVTFTSECWVWGRTLDRDGYGHFYFEGRKQGVHRVVYEALVEPIPESLVIDHICKNRACVNPEHMEVVTAGVNTLRGDGPSARHARATSCIHGHPFTTDNTYRNGSGRSCKKCKIERACGKIPCVYCGKLLARGGMKAHERNQHE